MKVSKRINKIRMRIMHQLTKNIGNSHKETMLSPGEKPTINRVLISRPNHRLGNQLLLTPLVQEVINTFPNCKIDLFVKGGVANLVFQNYEHVDTIIQLPRKPFNELIKYIKCWFKLKKYRYDLVINGDKNSSSGRLSTQIVKAPYKVFGETDEELEKMFDDYDHIAKYPVYHLRKYLNLLGYSESKKPIPTINIKLSDDEISKGKATLKEVVKNDKPTICIYTNATGDKIYDEDWWAIFYNRLKSDFPNYNIMELLPIENISKINFKAPNHYSEDVREMCGLLANTAIFIAPDNGVMHLASAAQIPVVGFFKVTKLEKYQPYGNKSIAFNTNETNLNDWLKGISNILG
ncbi:glycosyltransferase family 9 protein [Yeosuana marina]|uniref:glycosyltransferase family 9 protein n=1 Tax=Yeosuana marina TaxID=1565536 RepID=UPI001420FA90|nr:glycosyltransferase family 9 protein [Yeosuana marina]